MSYKKMKEHVEKEFGFSVGERYDMPDSELRFPGGAHARMEISGIENCENLRQMVDEAEKRDVTVHRVISLVKGATLLDDAELKEFATIGAENNLEILVNPCASRGWDNGRQYITEEGYVSGMRLRGHDAIKNYIHEIYRCIDLGIRGFLVTDEGMLRVLNSLRDEGLIPEKTTFKVSVFAGHGTAAGGQLLQKYGADSFNPLGDMTLPMLSSIRQGGVDIPLDIYMSLVESMGGFQRFHNSAEIARVAAPVYYKIEPGPNEKDMYNTWADSRNPEFGNRLARDRVKLAQIIEEWIDRSEYDIVMNDHKDDLCVPVV